MKTLSKILQIDWGNLCYHINPKYWDFETWCNIILIAMYAWFTWYIARLIYYCHVAKKLYQRQCAEKGIDWKIEGRRGERQFLRAIGLKFLIRKQYRNLDE